MMDLLNISNNVPIKYLVTFVTIAEKQSFTLAAQRLYLTQSTLTAQIKQLESNLGVTLFDRTTRSVELTILGQSFLPIAKRLLNDYSTAIDEVFAQAQGKRGTVKLASSPSVLSGLLPNLVKSFRDENPQIGFLMHEYSAEKIEASVRDGTVDFGIGGNHSNHSDLRYTPLLMDQYGIVSLAKQQKLTWQSLTPKRLVWLSSDTGIRRELMDFVKQHKLSIDMESIELETSSPAALASMVTAGLGDGLIPAMAASTPAFSSLEFTPLEAPTLLRVIYLIERRERAIPPVSQHFIENIKEHLRKQPLPEAVTIAL